MPPIKTYIFISESDNVEVTIKAYNENSATDKLIAIVRNPINFELKK